MRRILIFANGELPNLEKARALIRADETIIAADGGLRHALALGLTPDILVGDLDSTTVDLQPLTQQGMQVFRFPHDKNETDLELALHHALALKPTEIIILAALGGRLDQTLGNIALLVPRHPVPVSLDDGIEEIFFCREQAKIRGSRADLVSLVPWADEVRGVLTEDLKWPLYSETLYPDKTRGISNEMLGEEASVKIESGLLLIVHRRQS